MNIDIIVACDKNYGIGLNNFIPWNIDVDKKYFYDITTTPKNCNAVIMGKKTYESLKGMILKDRISIIISTTLEDNIENYKVFKNLQLAIEYCNSIKINTIFIIGGSQLYNEVLKSLKFRYLYLTYINDNYDCDINISESSDVIKNLNIIKNFDFNIFDKEKNKFINVIFYKLSQINILKKNYDESNYLDILYDILKKGKVRQTRNALTTTLFARTLTYDLQKGFPLLTTKKISLEKVFYELMLFIRGQTDTKLLEEKNVNIWKDNTSKEFLSLMNLNYKEGDIGPMYGYQLRHFGYEYKGCDFNYDGKGYDQLSYCLNLIKNDPHSRRIIMTTYNPLQANEGVLYPCHGLVIQFYIDDDTLNLIVYQRSADWFLGVPFNIASYSLLLHLICNVEGINYKVGNITMHFGDVHLYNNHYEQAMRQLLREPYDFGKLEILNKRNSIENFEYSDIKHEYQNHSFIQAKMIA